MYSKEENLQLKKEFWITFSQVYPKKWLLYNTQIKDFSFKFFIDKKVAKVMLDIEHNDIDKRMIYFEKIVSLKSILKEDYIKDIYFERHLFLENGKEISRVWTENNNINFYKKECWNEIFSFFYENMQQFENFFFEFQDYINDLEINT